MKTSEILKQGIELKKQRIAEYEAEILEIGVAIGKLAAKGKLEDVKSETRRLSNRIQWIKEANEVEIPELVERMEEAERQESGLGKVSEVLNQLFEDDMEFFHRLQASDYSELRKKVSERLLPKAYLVIYSWSEAQARKEFKRDLNDRFVSLKNKVTEKVGEIQDLQIERNDGNGFDGWVKGDKGTARIETIIAGGYNIQRAHIRTLVK